MAILGAGLLLIRQGPWPLLAVCAAILGSTPLAVSS